MRGIDLLQRRPRFRLGSSDALANISGTTRRESSFGSNIDVWRASSLPPNPHEVCGRHLVERSSKSKAAAMYSLYQISRKIRVTITQRQSSECKPQRTAGVMASKAALAQGSAMSAAMLVAHLEYMSFEGSPYKFRQLQQHPTECSVDGVEGQ